MLQSGIIFGHLCFPLIISVDVLLFDASPFTYMYFIHFIYSINDAGSHKYPHWEGVTENIIIIIQASSQ